METENENEKQNSREEEEKKILDGSAHPLLPSGVTRLKRCLWAIYMIRRCRTRPKASRARPCRAWLIRAVAVPRRPDGQHCRAGTKRKH